MKTQLTSALLAGAILATAIAPSFAQSGALAVRLDGQPLALSAAPLQVGGRTLLPLRDVFESLGLGVNWNPAAQSIAAQNATTQIALGINNRVAFVNGRNVSLDQPAILVGGRAFVPLRFVAEATGARVDYSAPLQLVSIQKANSLAFGTPIGAAPLYAPAPRVAAQFRAPGARRIAVPADAVIPVQLDSALSSRDSRVGQRFTASIVSHRMGDSEFPAGTKLEGQIVEARPSEKNQPGVLDLRFQTAILPDGSRVPLRGELTSLDAGGVSQRGGRLVAKGARKNDTLKVVGIGAGAGFVLGKVLGTNSTVSTILGAGGGYLFGRARDRRAEDARIAANTTLGVRLLDPVRFRDSDGYSQVRQAFLNEGNRNFNPRDYGYDTRIDATPYTQYPGYSVADRLPAPAPADDYRPAAPDNGAFPNDNFSADNRAGDGFGGQSAPRDNANDYFGNDNRDGLAQRISVPSGAVIPLRIEQRISSATARVGDEVTASIDSQRMGDSEFPAGTRVIGTVIEARPRQGEQPGVLDFDFRTAQLPTGERVPLRGELISLDDQGIQPRGGRLVATGRKSSNDRAKVIGIGAVAGFAIGRLLNKNGVLPAAIGALGGYLYGQKSEKTRANEAVIPQNTRLGLRLDDAVSYNGGTYTTARAQYLRSR